MDDLTPEQRARMEKSRLQALALKANKMKMQKPIALSTNPTVVTSQVVGSPVAKVNVTSSHHFAKAMPLSLNGSSAPKQSGTGNLFVQPKESNGHTSQPNGIKRNMAGAMKPVPIAGTSSSWPSSASSSGSSSSSSSPAKVGKIKVKIHLSAINRLTVQFPFNTQLVESMKSVPSSRYEQLGRTWNISIDDYLTLIEKLKPLPVDLDSASVPARVVSIIQKERNKSKLSVDLTERLPADFVENMLPFQREGVIFGIHRDGRCLIADEMGLGKTVQAIALSYWYKDDWPLLVVCPASVCVNWKNELTKWIVTLNPNDVEVIEKQKEFPRCKVVIMSYERLQKHINMAKTRKVNFLILDESHQIKTFESQRCKAAIEMARSVDRVILLSGTPALSRPMELFTQILAINPNLFPKKHDFGVRYCNAHLRFMGKNGPQMFDYSGASNQEELKFLLECTVMIRRMKCDTLESLPKKQRQIVTLDIPMDSEEMRNMDKARKKLEKAPKSIYREALMEWYHSTAKTKAPVIIEYLKKKLLKTNKLICFIYHKVMMETVVDFLTQERIGYIVITGETAPKDRQNCCNHFQDKIKCRVAVVSIIAAGVGITLTAAHDVVFTELYWNPGALMQAEDRAHRIGQKHTVSIEYLLGKLTVDEHIWKIVGRKLDVLGKVGIGTKDHMKNSATRDVNQKVMTDFFKKKEEKPVDEFDDDDDDIFEILMAGEPVIQGSPVLDVKGNVSPKSDSSDDIQFVDDDDEDNGPYKKMRSSSDEDIDPDSIKKKDPKFTRRA